MTGATGSIYTGLHEFEDMAFVLHLLRQDDLFIDIGANIGSYTILAGAAVGARCISFEPLPATYAHFMRNICLNDIKDRVTALNCGVGDAEGVLCFTSDLDTVNHVANQEEMSLGSAVEVKVFPLDTIIGGEAPTLIKIDVEGFETNVIKGARSVLIRDSLRAVIMELNGSGARYGFDEQILHNQMLDFGFSPYTYSPFDRKLISLNRNKSSSGNTLYIRNPDSIQATLSSAPTFHVHGQNL
jgi:FkbM family methyltransferase